MDIRIVFAIIFVINSFHLSFGGQTSLKILKIKDGIEKVNSIEELTDDLQNKKIVYIGENHNNNMHHEIQLKIIKSLYKKNNKIAIGMEMFQNDFQNIIDRFISGEISEKEFLKDTEYEKRWGFDYELYKPIIDFAKKNKIPVVALSINSEVTREISAKGLANLKSSELSMLPVGIDFNNKMYENFLVEFFKDHPKTEKSDFKKFYNIQIIWDEAMAVNIDTFIKTHEAYTMVVLAGNGHIMYSYGIPERSYRRNNIDFFTILNDTEHKKGISDFVIYSKEGNFH